MLVGTVGCGNKSESGNPTDNGGGSSQAIYETMTIEKLNEKTEENNDIYKNYVNKKIKITGLRVNDSKLMAANKLVTVTISCDNKDSLDIKVGDIVSVTGVVEDLSSMHLYFMNNCVIEK